MARAKSMPVKIIVPGIGPERARALEETFTLRRSTFTTSRDHSPTTGLYTTASPLRLNTETHHWAHV